jgi:hypothetical protein
MTPNHARYVGYARCSTAPKGLTAQRPRPAELGAKSLPGETAVLEIIGRLDTAVGTHRYR